MKRTHSLFAVLVAGFLAVASSLPAQVNIFSENMGTPGGTTAITSHTFQNTPTLTYGNGNAAGSADVRATNASTGYPGASGAGNIFFTSTTPERGFSIGSIDASGFTGLTLEFGARADSGTGDMVVEYSTDGGTVWNPITTVTAMTTTWAVRGPFALPGAAEVANLAIRWVRPTGGAALRLDDVVLKGTSTGDYQVDPLSVAFGSVNALSGPYTDTVDVTTLGAGAVSVTGVSATGSSAITLLTSLPLNVAGSGGTGTLTFQYNPAANDGSSASKTFTFTTNATPATFDVTVTGSTPTGVATLADLRPIADGTSVIVTGAITSTINWGDYNDFGSDTAIPAEDATAGVILHANTTTGIMDATWIAGTRLVGARGTLTRNFGVEQLSITGFDTKTNVAAPAPTVITLATHLANIDTYESRLIQFNNIQRIDGVASGNWAEGTNYTFNDGNVANNVVFRFADNSPGASNLVGQPLPALNSLTTMVGIGTNFSSVSQVSPVSPLDYASPDDPNVSAAPALSFPLATVGTPISATITITNSGLTNALNITGTSITGAGAPRFSVTAGGTQTIAAAGGTGDITVQFDAASAGVFTATLAIASNDSGGSPFNVNLFAQAGAVEVATIADARAELDGTYIKITGQVVLSMGANNFLDTSVPERIYPVQDATGGLLFIESATSPILPAGAGAGLVVIGATGERISFARGAGSFVEELDLDSVDSFFGSTLLNVVFPTVSQFNAAPNDYESELVGLLAVRRIDGDASGNWNTGTNYTFQDAGGNSVIVRLRDNLTDLFGTPLPALNTPTVIFGIGDEFGGVAQLAPIAASDFFPVAPAADWDLFE